MLSESRLKSLLRLWRQFLPLSLSDVTMALGDPAVTMTLANLPNPRENLAAVGTAKALAVFFESPIIMVLHASNTMAADAKASKVLRKLTIIAMGVLTLALTVLSFPFIFHFAGKLIFGLSDSLAEKTREVIFPMAIWPAAIAWRRFYQGILIRAGYAGAVAQAGIGRIAMLISLLAGGYLWAADGARLVGFALAGGVLAEALLVTILAKRLNAIPQEKSTGRKALPHSLSGMWRFYWPLANSMVVVWGGRALLIAIIARAIDGRLALAVWPAAWGLVVVISNATRMVQQVIIRNRQSFADSFLMTFAGSVGLLCSFLLIVLGHTKLGTMALRQFTGGDPQLESAVIEVVTLCALLPLLIAFQNAVQGMMIDEGKTGQINAATYLGTAVLLSAAVTGISQGFSGSKVAAASMVLAISVELAWLAFRFKSLRASA